MKFDDVTKAKWYDGYTDWDKRGRNNRAGSERKLVQCADQIKKLCKKTL